jgi:hypothetical protein
MWQDLWQDTIDRRKSSAILVSSAARKAVLQGKGILGDACHTTTPSVPEVEALRGDPLPQLLL